MGGRWDATNVADGQVAVITPIDIDHTHFLGSTIEDIATEKAGIIKPGAAVVTAEQDADAASILTDRAEQVGARLYAAGPDFEVVERAIALGGQRLTVRGIAGVYADLYVPLFGRHQGENAAIAIAAVEAFFGGGERPLDPEVVRSGLASVTSPGRLEVVRRSPTILVDAAHNPHGMAALRAAIGDAFTFTRLVGLVAMFADKDVAAMLEEIEPELDHVVVTRNSSPRSMDPARLGAIAADVFGADRVSVVPLLPDAIDEAVRIAELHEIGGAVLATGSVVTAADVRALLGVKET